MLDSLFKIRLPKQTKEDYISSMPIKGKESVPEIYQLKISLLEIKPLIWRRLLVSENATLYQLHRIIQAAFDWLDYHLHLFELDEIQYSLPEFELAEEWEVAVKNEKRYKLNRLNLKPESRFLYEYDFGDSWRHEILFEQILSFEKGARYPKCVAGEQARPPEDVGGVSGYEYFLKAVNNPRHPEHEEYMQWSGGQFDAAHFSLDESNERIWKAVK